MVAQSTATRDAPISDSANQAEKLAKRALTIRTEENDPHQRPLEFRLIVRLLKYTRPYAARRNWLILIVLIRSVQLPALTWVLAAVINGPIQDANVSGVVWGAFGFAVLAISTQLVMHVRQRLAMNLGQSVVMDVRNDIYRHIQSMPMSWFNRTKVGRVISRVGADVEAVRIGVQEVLFVSLVQIGQMMVAAAAMLWYDPVLFLLVMVLAPIIWTINRTFHRMLSRSMRRMRESYSRVVATLAESVNGIRVTQGFARQDENAELFASLAETHSSNNTIVMRTQGMFVPLLEFNNQLFIALLLLVGGYRVLAVDAATVGDLVAFFFMANLFFAPIAVLGGQYNQALTAMAGAERVFSLLDTEPDWVDSDDAIDIPTVRGRVEFEDVTFGYEADRPVLHEVSFTAEPGETVALVGHTGSGKTTIINLISKFYLPNHGAVRIDGFDLRDISGPSLHCQMGIVLQQNFLFQGTVADNIRFGGSNPTDDDVVEAVRRLDCLDLLDGLPRGLETVVGERGVTLSSGQRQLICFARAMLADPRILILDEATSSIDAQTEARLQAALQILLEGRTSFVVAHRLSTIRDADQVLVLDHGRIVERGTHDSLLAEQGVYSTLYHRFVDAQ